MSPPETKYSPLAAPVTSLWGVGGERAAQLARLGIVTIEDLLLHAPRRYEDRRHFRKIAELTKDEPFTARGVHTTSPSDMVRLQQIPKSPDGRVASPRCVFYGISGICALIRRAGCV
jgi:RecG-like helicase